VVWYLKVCDQLTCIVHINNIHSQAVNKLSLRNSGNTIDFVVFKLGFALESVQARTKHAVKMIQMAELSDLMFLVLEGNED
jgi:hypothetical protein